MLSTLALTAILAGCLAPRVKVIAADRAAAILKAGIPYTPAIDGYFVPKARMLDILNELDRARISEESK